MNKPKLKVLLFVDSEGEYYYSIPSPHFNRWDMLKWKINKIRGVFYRYPIPARNGIINIINTCKSLNQKIALCITGHLYLKSCNGYPHFKEQKPQNEWYHNKIGNDWYYWDKKGGNYKTRPGYFFGDILEKEKSNPLFTFGLHSFTHESLTLESKETISSIIESGILAAKKLGININCFACPFEMTSDEKDPQRIFDILRKNKIKNVFHAGKDNGLKIKRSFSTDLPKKEAGLTKLWISNYFEGTSNDSHIQSIIKQIERNRDKDAVFCLGTHDFTHKNSKNLTKIIRYLKDNNFENYDL
jgi:hypothetical protein